MYSILENEGVSLVYISILTRVVAGIKLLGMDKSINLKKTARTILNTNQYMTLGTVDENNQAWVSVVVYATDEDNNLYFMSLPSSRHCIGIKHNPRIGVAIYDSHQLFGEGIGLQIVGEASEVRIADSMKVFKYYFGRNWPYGSLASVKDFKKFFKIYKYRFYKVRPTEVWMNDPRKEYDARVKVTL